MRRKLYPEDWAMLDQLAACAVAVFREREGHLPDTREAVRVELDLSLRTHERFPRSSLRKAIWRVISHAKLTATAPPLQ